jgi:hypothetical protein
MFCAANLVLKIVSNFELRISGFTLEGDIQ